MSLADDAAEPTAPAAPPPRDVVASSSHSLHSAHSVHALPEGTRLRDHHEVTGLIGEGGFGIVYLAYDHSLQRRVAIKEYMPSAMASRASGSNEVVVKSARHVDTFVLGLKSFVNEARLLARFDNPSLVKVYRFWEENGTAYMVMPYYEGPTLKRALAELGRPPSEAELRAWLRPLLDALTVMHAARCYHRDIAPDNILLTPSGPLLLDFGAARRVIGDVTHALTVMLKPGYAPIEQYGEMSTMAQGAWTDLYALACVVYFAIMGRPPMTSVERLMGDTLEPLSVVAAGRYTPPFLQAIDAALALRPQGRPQSVAELRDLLDGRSSRSAPAAGFAATTPSMFDALPGALATPQVTVAAVPPLPPPPPVPPPAPGPVPIAPRAAREPVTLMPRSETLDSAIAEPGPPRRSVAILAVTGVVLVLVAGGYLALRPASAPVKAAADAASSVAVSPAPPAVVAAPAPTPASASASASASAPAPAPAPAPTPARVEPTPAPPAPAPETIPVTTAPPPPKRTPAATSPTPTPTPRATASAKCSDILQKASLEPLTASEAEFLKKECR